MLCGQCLQDACCRFPALNYELPKEKKKSYRNLDFLSIEPFLFFASATLIIFQRTFSDCFKALGIAFFFSVRSFALSDHSEFVSACTQRHIQAGLNMSNIIGELLMGKCACDFHWSSVHLGAL